jgi:hypothetical protein
MKVMGMLEPAMGHCETFVLGLLCGRAPRHHTTLRYVWIVNKGSPYTPLKAARGGHTAHHARPAEASGPRPRYSFFLFLFFFCFFFYVSFLLFQNLKKSKFRKN